MLRVIWRTPEDWTRSANGGDYGSWTDYWLRPDGLLEYEHGTTAEFSFCRVFGGFEECERCPYWDDEWGRCEAELQTIRPEELAAELGVSKELIIEWASSERCIEIIYDEEDQL